MLQLPSDWWKYRIDSFAAHMSAGEWKILNHLSWITDQVQPLIVAGGARIRISMPPRHGKSLYFSKWLPIWWMTLHPTTARVILASYEATFAAKWGRKVRDHFKDRGLVRGDLSGANDWELTTGASMQSSGVGGPLTGSGGDLLLADDLHKNWDEAHSPAKLETLKFWWASTFWTRREPGCSVVLIGTRWSNNDIFSWVEKEYAHENWLTIELPAIAEDGDQMGRAPGEALYPEQWPVSELLKIKQSPEAGPTIWSAMYRQRPEQQGGNIWKRDWFKYWSVMPTDLTRWCQSWDMTFHEGGTSWVCGQVWACRGPDRYLIDQVRGRWDFVETRAQLLALRKRWPQTKNNILIEKAANGYAVMSSLKQKVGGIIPISVSGNGSKISRAYAVQGLFFGGNVYVPARSTNDWVQGYVDECSTFPNGTANDQVDTTSQSLQYLMSQTKFRMAAMTVDKGAR